MLTYWPNDAELANVVDACRREPLSLPVSRPPCAAISLRLRLRRLLFASLAAGRAGREGFRTIPAIRAELLFGQADCVDQIRKVLIAQCNLAQRLRLKNGI